MNLMDASRAKRPEILRAAVILIAGLSVFILSGLGSAGREAADARAKSSASSRVLAPSTAPSGPLQENYLLDFAGDHSLSAATVTEQVSNGRANYTVQLHLASGAEQSVIVPGPPGGLHIEMHDMTGDSVPNDVVLRPALFSGLPTVLVNDGHDHFAVVVSGVDPGNFTSPAELGSRRGNVQSFVFLRSSRSKSTHLPASKRTLIPQLQQRPLSPFRQSFAWGVDHVSRSDRAPPSANSI